MRSGAAFAPLFSLLPFILSTLLATVGCADVTAQSWRGDRSARVQIESFRTIEAWQLNTRQLSQGASFVGGSLTLASAAEGVDPDGGVARIYWNGRRGEAFRLERREPLPLIGAPEEIEILLYHDGSSGFRLELELAVMPHEQNNVVGNTAANRRLPALRIEASRSGWQRLTIPFPAALQQQIAAGERLALRSILIEPSSATRQSLQLEFGPITLQSRLPLEIR